MNSITNQTPTDALLYAISPAGSLEEVKQHIEQKADVNAGVYRLLSAGDGLFGTPLHKAIMCDRVDMVEALIHAQADVNVRTTGLYDLTPLHFAVEMNVSKPAQALLDANAEIDAFDGKGNTPLQLALDWGHESIFKLLVKNGAILPAKWCEPKKKAFGFPEVQIDRDQFRRIKSVQQTTMKLLPIFRLFLDPDRKN